MNAPREPLEYRGRQIIAQRGGYTVYRNGKVETSQPSLAFAKKWVDKDIAGAKRLINAIFEDDHD